MDGFAAWLHEVAQPFSRLLCTPDLPSIEWEWRVHSNPGVITTTEHVLFNAHTVEFCFHKNAVYSAHTRMAIAHDTPSILDGFEQGMAALHARVQSAQHIPARYLFHVHDTSQPHPVKIAYRDVINSTDGVPFMPIDHAQDLHAFVEKVRAVSSTRRALGATS